MKKIPFLLFAIFTFSVHARIVSLSDELFNATQIKSENIELVDAQRSVLLILEDLLRFIWDNFSVYCDSYQKIPEKSKIEFIQEISEQFEDLNLPE